MGVSLSCRYFEIGGKQIHSGKKWTRKKSIPTKSLRRKNVSQFTTDLL